MYQFHTQLQEVTAAEQEDNSMNKACYHFIVSKRVLKGAFRRFELNISRKKSVRSVTAALKKVYDVYIMGKMYHSWAYLMLQKKECMRLEERRIYTIAATCFTRWKTYSALEAYFRRQARKRTFKLVDNIFGVWKDFCRSRKWDHWAFSTTKIFQSRLTTRHVFFAWKAVTIFIPWTGDWLRVPMKLATRHWKRRILVHWRIAVEKSSAESFDKINGMNCLLLKRSWYTWKCSRLSVPMFVRNATRRFLRELRFQCTERSYNMELEIKSHIYFQNYKCRQVLWRLYYQSRAQAKKRKIQDQLMETQQQREIFHWRNVVRSVLYLWGARSLYLRRVEIAFNLAVDFRRSTMTRRGLDRLRRCAGLSGRHISTRKVCERRSRWAFLLWRERVMPIQQKDTYHAQRLATASRSVVRLRQLTDLAAYHFDRVIKKKILPQYFNYLYQRSRYLRARKTSSQVVQRRRLKSSLSANFCIWRCLWSKRLCWRMKAATIDQSELFAQVCDMI